MSRLIVVTLASVVLASPTAAAVAPDHHDIVALQAEVKKLEAEIAHAGTFLKHAWPSLTDNQKAALTKVLKTLPRSTKFDIICNTASCDDLAEDIDDAMEAAGLSSDLDHSAGPLGYGVGVMVNPFDQKTAEKAIAALKQATGGAVAPTLVVARPAQNPPGHVTLLIGKHRSP